MKKTEKDDLLDKEKQVQELLAKINTILSKGRIPKQ